MNLRRKIPHKLLHLPVLPYICVRLQMKSTLKKNYSLVKKVKTGKKKRRSRIGLKDKYLIRFCSKRRPVCFRNCLLTCETMASSTVAGAPLTGGSRFPCWSSQIPINLSSSSLLCLNNGDLSAPYNFPLRLSRGGRVQTTLSNSKSFAVGKEAEDGFLSVRFKLLNRFSVLASFLPTYVSCKED